MRALEHSLSLLMLAALAHAQGPALVAHYKLDETVGTDLAESTGQGADAALQGTYQLGTLGAAAGTGGAVTFDPTGLGMGVIPDGPNLTNLRNDLSVTAWVKPMPRPPKPSLFGISDPRWILNSTAIVTAKPHGTPAEIPTTDSWLISEAPTVKTSEPNY